MDIGLLASDFGGWGFVSMLASDLGIVLIWVVVCLWILGAKLVFGIQYVEVFLCMSVCWCR